jgi:alpha-amylase
MTPGHDAIVQLFDWPFRRCQAELPALAAEGYGAIQISPPQLSIDAPDWWGRYQPVDHTRIEGPLGSEAELRELTRAAHALGLKVIVDVVLNHMAKGCPHFETLQYPRFGPEHFHPRAAVDYNDLRSIREGWIGHGPDLPDLDTAHPHVREEARRYLALLLDCGADGFRFDAVKHIEPAFFDAVLGDLPASCFCYGEYILQPGHFALLPEYLRSMKLMDFSLYQSLAQALGPDGDWAALDRLDAPEAALPTGLGLAFVTNHDLELEQYGGFALPPDGIALAHAFTTCRLGSVPLVWMEHRDDPVLRAALQLRRVAAPAGWQTVHASAQLLVWRSPAGALLVFNAAFAPRHFDAAWLGGAHTGWVDLVAQAPLDPLRHVIAPRQPALFLRP